MNDVKYRMYAWRYCVCRLTERGRSQQVVERLNALIGTLLDAWLLPENGKEKVEMSSLKLNMNVSLLVDINSP